MTPEQRDFSIVVIGAWNPTIFSADWIIQHLIEDEGVEVEVAFPVEDVTSPRRIRFSGLSFFPGRRKLEVTPDVPTLDNMKKCSSLVSKIMTLLSHTPVTDVGINFGFIENNPSGELAALFELSDVPKVLAEYTTSEANINRIFKKEGNDGALILNISEDDNVGATRLRFNFHYENKGIEGSLALLTDDEIAEKYNEAIHISGNFYSLELEEAD